MVEGSIRWLLARQRAGVSSGGNARAFQPVDGTARVKAPVASVLDACPALRDIGASQLDLNHG
jgi:hypothetical protein